MHLLRRAGDPGHGFDFTPILFATVLLFVIVSVVQFAHGIAGAEHGVLLFEKACPIYNA
jgi:hypothetical protein